MTDKGKLAMDLMCPDGHVVGQLIQDVGHQAIGIQVSDTAREEWPRGGDKTFTYLTCPGCDRRVYGVDGRDPGEGDVALRVSPSGRADTRCATSRTA